MFGIILPIKTRPCLNNLQFVEAPADGPTNLMKANFSVISTDSTLLDSLNPILLVIIKSITDPQDSKIASDTGNAMTQDMKYFTSDVVSSSSL